MRKELKLFKARLSALSENANESQTNALCIWIIKNVDKDMWQHCRSIMQYENLDTYRLSEAISECGVN